MATKQQLHSNTQHLPGIPTSNDCSFSPDIIRPPFQPLPTHPDHRSSSAQKQHPDRFPVHLYLSFSSFRPHRGVSAQTLSHHLRYFPDSPGPAQSHGYLCTGAPGEPPPQLESESIAQVCPCNISRYFICSGFCTAVRCTRLKTTQQDGDKKPTFPRRHPSTGQRTHPIHELGADGSTSLPDFKGGVKFWT